MHTSTMVRTASICVALLFGAAYGTEKETAPVVPPAVSKVRGYEIDLQKESNAIDAALLEYTKTPQQVVKPRPYRVRQYRVSKPQTPAPTPTKPQG